ncbi:CHAT domain-containing protein [Suillus subluteus]|nr:CHAT domain-containing protein [Suillus subluteus]
MLWGWVIRLTDTQRPGHPTPLICVRLFHLAISLLSRFTKCSAEDLDEAIALQREVLALHHVRVGNAEYLDQAIALHKEALASCPVGHTYRSLSLNNLAAQLSIHFDLRGNAKDSDQAIALLREALALRYVSHTDWSLSLNNLAACNAKDLDKAITPQREVLDLRPVGHTHQSLSLNNLAIALQREALALRPVGHTDWSSSLNNLAAHLFTHFHYRGNAKDLDEAVTLQREALALCPVGHTYWFLTLNNLATQLSTHFHHRSNAEDLDEGSAGIVLCNAEDLDEAIALHREVLTLCPVGHRDQSSSLGGLAVQLSARFDHQGNVEDLDEAITLQREALALCPVGHTDRSKEALALCPVHISLANVYLSFHQSGLDGTVPGKDTNNMNAAMHHFKAAVNVIPAGFLRCLHASLRWLEAYATSMQLLDAYMSTTASVSSRTLVIDAASCALHSKLLEQGRTLVWTQMTQLCTPLDSLQTRGDHAVALMERFRDLSSLLDKSPASHPEASRSVAAEAEATQYRCLVEDWNRVVEEIRKSSCNAIIIWHHQSPTSIQLPTNFLKLVRLVLALQEGINKEASPKGNQPALTKALRELWNDIVCPYRANGESLLQQYISSCMPSLTVLLRARRSHDRSPSAAFAAIGQNLPDGTSFMLDGVEPELDLVQSLLPPSLTVSFTKITSIDAMKSRVLYALRDNTWLHLSCHGTQKLDEPFKSAFLMRYPQLLRQRDQPLSLLDITEMDLSQYQFAFLSACETAAGDLSTPDEVIHLVAGLQFAGVKSIIGTLWKVNNSTVQHLVEAFYKNFCGDGTMNSK